MVLKMNYILTLTGPSGIGKTYIKRKIKEKFGLSEPPVYTTRPLREISEINERIYLSENEFKKMEKNGEFLFVNEIFGYKYGLKKIDLIEINSDKILELYIDNVDQFRKLHPQADMIALLPVSLEFLEKRLEKRDGNKEEDTIRLKNAEKEIKLIKMKREIFNLIYIVDSESEKNIVSYMLEYVKGKLK